MTTSEVAKVLGTTREWVWKLIQTNKLKAVKVGARPLYLIDPAELRRYMTSLAKENDG